MKTPLSLNLPESSRIAVAEPVVAASEVGTAKECLEAALADLANREADPDVE